jgi:hypothetical protein
MFSQSVRDQEIKSDDADNKHELEQTEPPFSPVLKLKFKRPAHEPDKDQV